MTDDVRERGSVRQAGGAPWNRAKVALGIALIAALFTHGAVELLDGFPGTYTWTELLMGYQAGFIRRGLLGTLAYLVDPLFRADLALTLVLLTCYLLVGVTVTVGVLRDPSWSGLFCLVSPGLLLFPLWDRAAFGRKDVVILSAFVLALWAIRRAASPWRCLAVLAVIYAVAGLIHETAVAYFVAAVAAMLLLRPEFASAQIPIAAAALGCVLAWGAVTIAFPGSVSQADGMMDAWRERYPSAYENAGAASWIGLPVARSYETVVFHQSHLATTAGYLLGFTFTAVPVMVLARRHWQAITARRRTWIATLGVAAMLATFAIAADWGRFSHLLWMHALLFLLTLRAPVASGGSPPRFRVRQGAGIIGLVVYAGTWYLLHYAAGGDNPLRPGPLLWWL